VAHTDSEPNPFSQPPPVIDLPTTETGDVSEIPLSRQYRNLLRQIRQQGLPVTLIEAYDQFHRMVFGIPTRRMSEITPQLAIGGQHLRRGLRRMRQRNFTAIVNMRREYDDREGGTVIGRYLYLPTIDNTPPTLEHLDEGAQFIAGEIARGGKVYVHCWEGVGRAPTMAAAYLVSTGITPDEAWSYIRATRPFIRPTPFQVAQVEAYAQQYHAQEDAPVTFQR